MHDSEVYVSELLFHNSSMVYAIIEKFVKRVKELVPNVQYIHFWTDSPTSQYRNKITFYLIQFVTKYGLKASWHLEL